ncbi:MAG: hypothetical protein JNJ62_15970 [Pseudoxanthomonas mexicana]|nr:hypothetical protein [Pseudoxanthomonas mexicana]
MHYVLIDHENVQPADLAGLNAENACVLVFTGAQQKVAISLVEAVQTLGERGRFVRISGNGKNALDFHIAYYLGKLSERDPQASYLLVTADSGYDPLIAHLNAQGITTKRVAPPRQTVKAENSLVAKPKAAKKAAAKKSLVITVEPGKAPPAKQAAARVAPGAAASDADKVLRMLAGMPNNLPRNEASLRRMIATWLSSKESSRLDAVIAEMKRRKSISASVGKLAYKLPKT